DVAEIRLIGAPDARVVDEQIDVGRVLLRRGGDPEHRVVGAVGGAAHADDMMVAGPEMKDRLPPGALRGQIVKEIHIARARGRIEAPRRVPEIELRHGEPRKSLKPRPAPPQQTAAAPPPRRCARARGGGRAAARCRGAGSGSGSWPVAAPP